MRLMLALCVCVVLLAEAGARLVVPERRRSLGEYYDQYLLEDWGPYFKVVDDGGRRFLIQIPRLDVAKPPQRIPLVKAKGTRRIIVVGESSAVALGDGLRRVVGGDGGHEIVSMGVGASGLESVERKFEEALGYEPDAIVLYFGSNLYYLHPQPTPALLRKLRLSMLLRPSRLLAGVGAMLRRDAVFRPEGRNEARLLLLERFLASASKKARDRGVVFVACGVPANLWIPPRMIPSGETAKPFLAARFLYHSGRKREAIRALKRLATDRAHAWWHFTLATWLYREGDYREALHQFSRAKDVDPSSDRAADEVNVRIERAAARDGFRYAGLPQLIAMASPHGIPGWESFVDQMHLRPNEIDAAAAECLRLLGRPPHAALKGARMGFIEDLQAALQMVDLRDPAYGTSLIYLAQADIHSGDGEKAAALASAVPDARDRALVLSYIADALWSLGRRDAARRANQEARELAPDLVEPCLQKGLFHLEAGEMDAAREWLERAALIAPAREDAVYFRDALSKRS